MKDESRIWFDYAEENLNSARVLFENELYNPCLQNVQQSVEKAFKALLIQRLGKIKKTHSIVELNNIVIHLGLHIDITEEECDFLDTIYLPSKYPLQSVLPNFYPDHQICQDSILIADRVLSSVKNELSIT